MYVARSSLMRMRTGSCAIESTGLIFILPFVELASHDVPFLCWEQFTCLFAGAIGLYESDSPSELVSSSYALENDVRIGNPQQVVANVRGDSAENLARQLLIFRFSAHELAPVSREQVAGRGGLVIDPHPI